MNSAGKLDDADFSSNLKVDENSTNRIAIMYRKSVLSKERQCCSVYELAVNEQDQNELLFVLC